ncbi:MAG: MATE family efflux transporter [Chloroflexia bacterium]
MASTQTKQSRGTHNGVATEARIQEDERAAEEAAYEVAETTDESMPVGMAVEPAAQAESLAPQSRTEAPGLRTELGQGEDTQSSVLSPQSSEEELTAEDRKDVSRTVFRLAWPAISENALQTLLGIVDTAVVARLGAAALAGVGASQQLIWVLTTALIAVSMGTTVLIARFTGASQTERSNAVLKQSLMLAALVGFALIPVSFLSHTLLSMLGLSPEATAEGATYLQITLAMAMVIVLMFVAGAALRGAGDTKTPMLVTAFINVINAVLAIVLVFGGVQASGIFSDWLSSLTHLQITLPTLDWVPAMGVAGSAWAAVIARAIGTVILFSIFLLPRSRLQLWRGGGWRPSFDLIGRILKIGIPSAVEQLLMSLGVLFYSFIVISMGELIFATSRLAINAVFLSQMPGFGFALAATTVVGQSLGAGQPQRARLGAWLATRSALIWMSVMGVIFFFFGRTILTVFTDDPRLLDLGDQAMKVIAFSQPPLALAFVLAGALRGAGDVRFPMLVTTIAVWLVRIPIGAFLGMNSVCLPFGSTCVPGLGWGLAGIYGALIVEASLRAVLFFRRFREGRWQKMKV